MRTVQKKIKFSKGMITRSLAERQDLPMYDSSAEDIRNYICTPYGGIRSRRGTSKIDDLNYQGYDVETYRFDCTSSYGTFTNYRDFASTSLDGVNNGTILATFTLVDDIAAIPEADIYFSVNTLFQLPTAVATFTSTGVQNQAELTDVTVTNGGYGFSGSMSVSGRILEGTTTLTPVVDSNGTVTSVTFESATYKYLPETPQNVLVTAKTPSCKVRVDISSDNSKWTQYDSYTITPETQNIQIKTKSAFKYMRFVLLEKGEHVRFNAENLLVQYEVFKMIPFVYNVTQTDLIVLYRQKIVIYEKDIKVQTISLNSTLSFQNLRNVKWTQNEDVIIFTESGVVPRELRRAANNIWTFTSFPLKNIPYHNFQAQPTETAQTVGITPSAVSGAVTITAASNLFDATWVGQQIDGNSGRLRITKYIDATHVAGYTIIEFLNTNQITSWTKLTGWEPVWSSTRGYPTTCLFYQQRLWFGGSKSRPSTVWGSRVGIYNDFANVGNYDNEAIDVDLNTENQIVNLLSSRGLQIFTSGDEWTASESALTPEKFAVVKNTANGSDIGLTPKNLGGVTLFIEKNGRSLLSYVYDYNQAAYLTSNIGILSSLDSAPVEMEIDDNSALDEGDYLYLVQDNGEMSIVTMDFEQEINARVRMVVSGQILNVCNVVNDTYLIIKTGNSSFYLAKIDDNVRTDLTITSSSLTANPTISIGQPGDYVRVYNSETDYGKYLLDSNNKITLPSAINESVNVGLCYDCELISNDMAINGRSTSVFKRISKAVVTTQDTEKLTFCDITKKTDDNIFDFFAPTSYSKKCKFTIKSEFDKVYVLSILLHMNYGVG